MNVALRDAMTRAGMTRMGLASKVGVSGKTVDRWLSDTSRVPHRRAEIAEALEVSADMLWPQAVQAAFKTGPGREILDVYPSRNECPSIVWARLIDGATRQITFAGYTNYFLWQEQARIADRLRAKVEAGCQVRFILGEPESEVTRRREQVEDVPLTVGTRIRITLDQLAKLGPLPGLEARFSDAHIALSVFRFDDKMLVSQHIAKRLGHDSPTFLLRRLQTGGLFDQYAHHVDALWAGGRPVPDVGGGS
ncbi:XRE family transcriptional regulator [Streptomyces virginiae]|uniref:XRE family transcriptional regulator n=1 Tax=Streptomyces virginiae TaxID=1961 RepID=UPI003415FD68